MREHIGPPSRSRCRRLQEGLLDTTVSETTRGKIQLYAVSHREPVSIVREILLNINHAIIEYHDFK